MTASVDDEVFFHHRGTPKVGKVKCAGQHGCCVHDEDGKEHKLKWEHIAGFKSRAPQRYHVVHQGEDGMIVQDGNGKRRLALVPPEAKQEQLKLDK